MNKGLKLKYPSAIKKRVKGDWNCANCMNLNFSFRKNCNLCGHEKDAPALFSCALYYDICSLFVSEECFTDKNPCLNDLPSVESFLAMSFMQKPTEVYLLNERCMNGKSLI